MQSGGQCRPGGTCSKQFPAEHGLLHRASGPASFWGIGWCLRLEDLCRWSKQARVPDRYGRCYGLLLWSLVGEERWLLPERKTDERFLTQHPTQSLRVRTETCTKLTADKHSFDEGATLQGRCIYLWYFRFSHLFIVFSTGWLCFSVSGLPASDCHNNQYLYITHLQHVS